MSLRQRANGYTSDAVPEFLWDDDSPLGYSNWREGEEPPEIYQPIEVDCVVGTENKPSDGPWWWEQKSCTRNVWNLVCERPAEGDGETRP